MSVVFSSGAVEYGYDDDQITCLRECVECLYQIFQLPKFLSALSVFETVVCIIALTLPYSSLLFNVFHKTKVTLLESVMLLGVACFSHTHPQQLQPTLLPALLCTLDYYRYLETTQGNPKKVFMSACQQLLCPALRLHGLLLTVVTPYQEGGACCGESSVTPVINALKNIFKSLFKR